jgi:hypothetical protein
LLQWSESEEVEVTFASYLPLKSAKRLSVFSGFLLNFTNSVLICPVMLSKPFTTVLPPLVN